RCVVGGIEKVFEINRNFRNEGTDSSHSPEFAMLEVYQAYTDYNGMAELTQQLVQRAAAAVFGSTVVRHHDGTEYDLGGEWRRVRLYDAVSEALGEHVTPETTVETLRGYADKHEITYDPTWGA